MLYAILQVGAVEMLPKGLGSPSHSAMAVQGAESSLPNQVWSLEHPTKGHAICVPTTCREEEDSTIATFVAEQTLPAHARPGRLRSAKVLMLNPLDKMKAHLQTNS